MASAAEQVRLNETLAVLLVHSDAGDGDLESQLEGLLRRSGLALRRVDAAVCAEAIPRLVDSDFDCAILDCTFDDVIRFLGEASMAQGSLPPLLVVADPDDPRAGDALSRAGVAGVLPRRDLAPALLDQVVRNVVRTSRAEDVAAIAADALRRMAFHDSLTQLPNRSLFFDRLEQAIAAARREKKGVALLMMDLNRFKEVNDTFGHQFGDQLLCEVAKRFSRALRRSDTVARVGGDEFAVLLPTSASLDGANQTADKIAAAIEPTFYIDGTAIEVDVSIGIALFPDHGEDRTTLLRHADLAMYAAKQSGGGATVFTPAFAQRNLGSLILKSELRYAIAHDELVLHYQPAIDSRSGRVVGVEALVRWCHPQHGLVPPDDFIGLAEQTRLIEDLTRWVLGEGLRQCAAWATAGMGLDLAINLSARALRDEDLPDQVARLLEQASVGPERLILEVTESAVMSNAHASHDVLERLHAMGVRLSIDDFGTGYSSLARLRRLPIDEVKIDKSFVQNVMSDADDAVIVRAIIDLGRRLGLRVVGEGVEDDPTWDFLRNNGCDAAQGFYLGRPVDAATLGVWLRESPWGLAAPS